MEEDDIFRGKDLEICRTFADTNIGAVEEDSVHTSVENLFGVYSIDCHSFFLPAWDH